MPNREQLESALRNADTAGDYQAAQQLANALKSLSAAEAKPQPVEKETTFGESIIGGLETAGTVLSSAVSEPAAGIAGIPFQAAESLGITEPGGAEAVVRGVQEAFTYQPRTETGQEYLAATGEALQPIAEGLESAEQFLGKGAQDIGLPPSIAAAAATTPTAALEALGVGAFKGASRIPKVAERVTDIAEKGVEAIPQIQPFTKGGKAKQRIAQLLEEGSADVETARYSLASPSGEKGVFGKLKEKLSLESPIEKSPLAGEAIKQGFDEGVIAAVRASSPLDKAKMSKMAETMQRGKKNKRYAMENRPTDIAGDSLMQRVRVIQSANKTAGKELDVVAKNLKGEAVDFSPAINNFVNDLDNMGVKIDENLKPDFIGSDIEGVKAAENVLSNIIKRMQTKKSPDAYDIHRMKKFIDEQVTYGKNAEGLAGKTEGVLKSLRRNLDEALDTSFPEYDRVNTAYAETIDALDTIQDVAGKKMDLTGKNADKATGTLMRRLMSNAQSRVNLVDAIDKIEGTANKYSSYAKPKTIDGKLLLPDASMTSKGFTDDLLSQILFADELDSVFGSVARTSFAGQTARGLKEGAAAVQRPLEKVVDVAAAAAEKARGINEDNAFKSIIDLLKE